MVLCCNCRTLLDENVLLTREDYVGEFWGSAAYESVGICPECKSDEIDYEYDLPDTCSGGYYDKCIGNCSDCEYKEEE